MLSFMPTALEPDPFPSPLHRLEVAARSHVGRHRDNNEDSLLVAHLGRDERHLFDLRATSYLARSGEWVAAVCDGMGGEAGGEVASRLATVVLDAELKRRPRSASLSMAREALTDALVAAARTIAEAAREPSLERMGTTATAAVVVDGQLVLAQVGDSRAYLFRGGKLTQLTEDQTLVAHLRKNGHPNHQDLAGLSNVILQALGSSRHLDVVVCAVELAPRDLVLLCSDGLSGPVPDAEIAHILGRPAALDARVDALVAAANAAGGPDNISCVLFDYLGLSRA